MKAISFAKGISWTLLLNVLIKPIWIFGIDRQLQNEVGHEAYGVYFSLLNLSIIFSFLADAGLSNLANIKLANGTWTKDSGLLQLKLKLSLLYAGVVFLVAFLSGIRNWELLALIVFIQVLSSFFVFLRSIITGHQLFLTDAWLSVFDKMVMILICGPFLYLSFLSYPINIILFLWIQLGSAAVAVLIAASIIASKKLFPVGGKWENKVVVLKSMLPFALIILLMSGLNRLDGFLLERLHPDGAYQAGIYASAYRLLDAGNMVGYLFASLLVPFLARNRAQKELVEKTILTARHFLVISGSVAAVFIIIFSTEVQQLLYHFATPFSTEVLQWCISVLPAYLLLHLYGSMLTAALQLRVFILILLGCVFLNAFLNIMWIPMYGAAACTKVAVVSQYLCAFCTMVLATKKYDIGFHFKSVLLYLFVVLFFGLLFYAAKYFYMHSVLILMVGLLFMLLLLFAYISFVKKTIILLR